MQVCRSSPADDICTRAREAQRQVVTTSIAASYKRAMPAEALTMEDADLVRAALAGEERSQRTIWDRYAPLARRIVGRSMGPECDVEDIVQDAFLGLFRNLRSLRDPSALRAFVISICIRSVRGEIRKKRLRRLVGLSPTPELVDARVVWVDHEARQTLQCLYRALDRLAFRERATFALRHIEGMELDEIAAALGVSTPTVRRSLAKAVERLTCLSQNDEALSLYFPVRE
jgi:RNA polymerase sigma-70 factor, ECF subfamily